MLEFLRWVLTRPEQTKDTARERLQMALLRDRMDLSPEVMEAMKQEVLVAISRYMVVGEDFLEFHIRRGDRSAVLVSNIQIKELNRMSAAR